MRLATFLPPGAGSAVAGEILGGEAVAFGGAGGVRERLASADLTPAGGQRWRLADVELLAPIPQPRAIFGIGLNYSSHAAEQGSSPPARPIVFMKLPSSAAAPGGPVRCPAVVRRFDYEGELAVVIGAGGRAAGYAVANDLSARDLQKAEPQWTRAKGADGFCPFGPWITTADELGAGGAGDLRLRTWVNGELRQDARTSELIFGVEALIEFISETCTLAPGDLILTGTPSGVGMSLDPPSFLQPGDTIRIEIEQLGWIEHSVLG